METIQKLQVSVKEAVKRDQESISDRVVNVLAHEVLEERTAQLVAAYKKREVLAKEITKIKPDVAATFDVDGNELVAQQYSEKTVKQIKQKKQELDKLDKAIERAVIEADYSGLKGDG